MTDGQPSEIKRSPVRFIAGGPDDPKHGMGRCVTCRTKIVNYQGATGVWIDVSGSSHKGHEIELASEMSGAQSGQRNDSGPPTWSSPEVEALVKDPALLYIIKIDLDKFIIGEDENKLHLFLICLSCMTSRPLGAVITGEASSGKSTLLHGVTRYFGNVDHFTRITAAALDRLAKDLTGRILVVEELRGAEAAQPTIRVAISEGKLRLLTVDRDKKGRITTREIETKGIPVFLTTTTAAAIDQETQARLDILSMDESEEQTKLVLSHEAEEYLGSRPTSEPEPTIREFLGKLRPFGVLIPFADSMAAQFPSDTISARRDFRKLLQLVTMSAFLHQHQRLLVKDREHPIQPYIVATPLDLRYAFAIAGVSLRQSLAGLPTRVLSLLQYFKEDQNETSRTIAKKTGFSQRTARRWLQSLVRAGHLSVDEAEKEHLFSLVDKPRQSLSLELPHSVREWNQAKLRSWLAEEGCEILRDVSEVPYVDPFTGGIEPLCSSGGPLTACQSEPENAATSGQTAENTAGPHETLNLSPDSDADSGHKDEHTGASSQEGDLPSG